MEYQKLAKKYKIDDIFQDNGGKYVQLLILLGLETTGDREGNDAFDKDGNEYEIKTVNIEKQLQFTTHHHMNPTIIEKYRLVNWYFAAYRSIELQVIYRLTPESLEPFYKKWEDKWHRDGSKDINNPKIPLRYVMDHGEEVWLPKDVKKFETPPKPPTKKKKAGTPKKPLKEITVDDI